MKSQCRNGDFSASYISHDSVGRLAFSWVVYCGSRLGCHAAASFRAHAGLAPQSSLDFLVGWPLSSNREAVKASGGPWAQQPQDVASATLCSGCIPGLWAGSSTPLTVGFHRQEGWGRMGKGPGLKSICHTVWGSSAASPECHAPWHLGYVERQKVTVLQQELFALKGSEPPPVCLPWTGALGPRLR